MGKSADIRIPSGGSNRVRFHGYDLSAGPAGAPQSDGKNHNGMPAFRQGLHAAS